MGKKRIGVYLDHHKAYFIPFENGTTEIKEIMESEYTRLERIEGETSDTTFWNSRGNASSNNENRKNNKAESQLKEYYNDISKKICEYDEILLFGPTTAKNELKNILCENKSFNGKTIHIQSADQITENQKKEFVWKFFNEMS
ncbi:MAG: hypothetical protein N3F09_10595 [Bacteroidia bacterium]|nr:hypothetical protein [Bacteroidia bacterium]